LFAGIFLETNPPKKSAVPHIKLDMSAKNAAMGLTYLMVWQNTDMALNLKDTFQSEFTIIELVTALKDIEFHKKRAESKSLKKIEFKTSEINELEISRQIDFDIPAAAQKMVSNPISLNENWNFSSQDLIKIQLSIPNIQTTISAQMYFEKESSGALIRVESVVQSKIFLMSSFAEEFVSKYWKKALLEDFEILNQWLKAIQISD
jgi:hypothetical protein